MLSDGAGTKTVYAQVKDAANNISAPITATVQLTATAINAAGSLPPPPVLNSAYHNAPMPHGSITIAQRDGNNLSLNLSASNDWAIFINQMAFSFDGQNWAGWIPFETSKQISLEGHSGATKIYVTFSDQAGGQSPIYSADIPAQTAQSQQSAQPAQSALPGQPAQTPAQQQGQAGQPPSGQSAQPAQGNPAANQPVSNNNAFVKAIERVKIREGEALRHEALRQQNQESDKAQREAERQKREEERLARAKERESAAAAALPTVAVSLPSASAALPSVSAALPAAAGPAVASQAAQKKIDVSVENIDVGRQAGLGDKVPVKVFLKNNSPVRVEGCAVRLENEDGLVDKQLIALQANERKTVEFIWLPKREGRQKLTAVIELSDDGNLRNNKMAQSIEVRKKEETGAAVQNAVISRPTEVSQETLPDASVENVDVPRRVEKDSRVNIIVTVRNNGTAAAQGCVVFVESEDGLAEKKDISLAANERGRETFTWTPKAEGRQKIHCRIECKGDSNERNNESSAMVLVASAADGIEKMRAAREAERELERSQHQEESRKEAGKKEEPAAVSPTISPAAVSAEADAGKQKEAELRQQEEAQQQAAEAQRQAAEAQRQKEEAQKKRELEKRLDKRGISGILSDESQKER
jgi:hypothetical protein